MNAIRDSLIVAFIFAAVIFITICAASTSNVKMLYRKANDTQIRANLFRKHGFIRTADSLDVISEYEFIIAKEQKEKLPKFLR